MPTKEDEQRALATLREDRKDLVKLLGEPFGKLLEELEEAEIKIASFVDKLRDELPENLDDPKAEEQEERILKALRYLSCAMATKGGIYAAEASIEFNVDPPLTFETIQNRAFIGFLAAVAQHRAKCGNPNCETVLPVVRFLDNLNTAFHQIDEANEAQDGAVSATPRDNSGKPIVH